MHINNDWSLTGRLVWYGIWFGDSVLSISFLSRLMVSHTLTIGPASKRRLCCFVFIDFVLVILVLCICLVLFLSSWCVWFNQISLRFLFMHIDFYPPLFDSRCLVMGYVDAIQYNFALYIQVFALNKRYPLSYLPRRVGATN
jgi:hypothetical protein